MVRTDGGRLILIDICFIYHVYSLIAEVTREASVLQPLRNIQIQMFEDTNIQARFSELPVLSLDIHWVVTSFISRKCASHLLGCNNIGNMCRTLLSSIGRLMFPIRRLFSFTALQDADIGTEISHDKCPIFSWKCLQKWFHPLRQQDQEVIWYFFSMLKMFLCHGSE